MHNAASSLVMRLGPVGFRFELWNGNGGAVRIQMPPVGKEILHETRWFPLKASLSVNDSVC